MSKLKPRVVVWILVPAEKLWQGWTSKGLLLNCALYE